MARPILGGSGSRPESRASCGGITMEYKRDVMNYKAPQGPKGINDPQGVGIHGRNYGNTNGPDNALRPGGSVGLGGENVGKGGTQGRY